MPNLFRGAIIPLLLIMIVLPAQALGDTSYNDVELGHAPIMEQRESTTARVRVIPDEATAGNQHSILITDLGAREEITIRIIFEESEVVIYESTETAGERGIIEFEILTETNDAPGLYRVEILNGSEVVIASTEMTVNAPAEYSPLINVNPVEAESGTIFTIDISGVSPFAVLEIRVDNESGEEIFSRRLRASVEGTAQVEYTSNLDNTGNLSITVLEDEITEILSTTITVTEQRYPATVIIEPSTIMPGDSVVATVSGLAPDTDVRLDITLDGEIVATLEDTANVNGLAIFSYDFAGDVAQGDYQFELFQNDEQVGLQTLTVDILPATITISPDTGTTQTVFFVTIEDLQAQEAILIELVNDGEVIQTLERTANDEGAVYASFGQDSDLDAGSYDIRVLRYGEEAGTQSITVRDEMEQLQDESPDVIANLDPATGTIPSLHTLTVDGLPAGTELEVAILFGGETIVTFPGTVDGDGFYSTEIGTVVSDEPGLYTFEIRVEGEVVATTELTLIEAVDESNDAEPSGEFSIRIVPDDVVEGVPFRVFVSGLTPGDEITIAVEYDGEVVFETDRTADDNGETELILESSPEDLPGTYTVTVHRGDESVSAEFNLDAQDDDTTGTPVEPASTGIIVNPVSGDVGTQYDFTISGLEPGEDITIVVTLGNQIVYETDRRADASGFYSISLDTNESDAPGTYTFSVLRDGEVVVSTEFEVGVSSDGVLSGGNTIGTVTPLIYADAIPLVLDAGNPVQVIEFEGQAGDVIHITVISDNGLDTIATLISPDGTMIVRDDDSGQGFDPEVERVVLPETGTYTLEIQTFTAGESGAVTVTINRLDERALEDNMTQSITLNSKITLDMLTYFAQAGDVISLEFSLENGTIGHLDVIAEQAGTALMSYQTSVVSDSVILEFVVPETGNILILFESDETADATLGVSIERE